MAGHPHPVGHHRRRAGALTVALAASFAAAALPLASCGDREMEDAAMLMTGGTPAIGREKIEAFGCVACHTIPGIDRADGAVGPPLQSIAGRTYIAGILRNTPDNLIRWLQDPPAIDPRTAMPNVRLSEQDARDIASFLYTLK